MAERLRAGFGNRKFSLSARRLSYLEYFIGLMFKSRNSENLLFDMPGRWGIHSWFVFFPFLALWLDEKNRVVEWKIVKPFSFFVKPQRKFAKLIEIPVNSKNDRIVQIFRR